MDGRNSRSATSHRYEDFDPWVPLKDLQDKFGSTPEKMVQEAMNLPNVLEVVIEDCENQGTKYKSNSLDRQWFLAAG